MNIFYLDNDPVLCAQYHCDAHLRKMLIETAQLLCGAHWATGGSAPYKATHINHPSAKWVRESLDNYAWLIRLGIQLDVEYTFRFGKRHKTGDILTWLLENMPALPSHGFSEPPQVVPDSCLGVSAIKAYRVLYSTDKQHLMQYTRRCQPAWLEGVILCNK